MTTVSKGLKFLSALSLGYPSPSYLTFDTLKNPVDSSSFEDLTSLCSAILSADPRTLQALTQFSRLGACLQPPATLISQPIT